MSMVLYPIFTVVNGILLPIGLWIYSQTQSFEMLILLVLMVGITYDNLIISIGRWLGEGKLLLWISQPRFFLHISLTPLTTLAALYQCKHLGVTWGSSPLALLSLWGLSLGLIIFDLDTYYRDFNPVPIFEQGTLRYTNASAMTPPLPAVITVLLVLGIGALVWLETGWAWLCLAALVMLIGSAIPPKWAGPALGSGSELMLMIGFWATEIHLQTGAV